MDALQKLAKSWPIVKWLDDARWIGGSSASNIPGPVFAALDEKGQLLTHWLCYITDQRRGYEQVWDDGGPVFAEVVRQYSKEDVKNGRDVLEVLCTFTRNNPGHRIEKFVSLHQRWQGDVIAYTPVLSDHMLSIARTLQLLLEYDKDLVNYLSANERFWLRPVRDEDSPIWRIGFLLHLLSYSEIHKGVYSFRLQAGDLTEELGTVAQRANSLLRNETELESSYRAWVRSGRFHKRLWAAFRDYLKPGSYYEEKFAARFRQLGCQGAKELLGNNRNELLSWVELPGDTWNLLFCLMMFGNDLTSPRELREAYTQLVRRREISPEFYPEQFDVSFAFSPRMCDTGDCSGCPFGGDALFMGYCHRSAGGPGKLCPIARITCGYEIECCPDSCPLGEGHVERLCNGWPVEKITTI